MTAESVMYQKEIRKDFKKAMLPSVCIYVLQETLFAILSVYISTQLGDFLNRVIYLESAGVEDNLWTIALCVFVGVVVLPGMSFWGETTMLRNSLIHDRLILGRFLRKTFGNAMKIDESEAQYRLENDAIDLRGIYQELIVKCAVIVCAGAFLLCQALPMSPLYTLIVFVVSMVRFVTPLLVSNVKARFDFQNREYKTNVRVCESMLIKNTWLAKMYGLVEELLQRVERLFEENYEKVESKKICFDHITDSVSDFVGKFSYVIIVFSGACLVGNGSIQAGVIAAMLGYLAVFDLIVANGKVVIETAPVVKNLIKRMVLLYEGEESEEGERLEEPIRKVETEGFGYCYGANGEVQKNEDCECDGSNSNVVGNADEGNKQNSGREVSYQDILADSSEIYFLKGSNGCGKSTLLKVLCGYYTGYNGSIRINGKELSGLNLPQLRQQIAYLEQEPYLFEGTVMENIWLGNLSASNVQVEGVAREMGVEHLLEETIGAGNTRLSGGELQRTALARLLLKKASLILLDEPEHYLDKEGRKLLEKKMKNSGKCILWVSHALEGESTLSD